LGADQEEFVKKTLSASKENNLKWRVLGNQVPIAPRWLGPFQAPNTVIGSVDKWEGYPGEWSDGKERPELVDDTGKGVDFWRRESKPLATS
jgi:phosphodiesterase/alkaline phosphatase D-like protein